MNLIVVVDKNWGIGKNNGLLFSLKKDMKFFRETTTGKVVVMGANTFLSFPNGALPNRVNVVLDDKGRTFEGALTVRDVAALQRAISAYPPQDVFVIGGASVYALLADCCSTAYVNKVAEDGGAQLFFPNLDQRENWTLQSASEPISDEGHTLTFCVYRNQRVKPLDAK